MSMVNPAFAKANGILAADVREGLLVVTATKELDPQSLRALEFASGSPVQVTVVPPGAAVEERPSTKDLGPSALRQPLPTASVPGDDPASASLAQRVLGAAGQSPIGFAAALPAVARLLATGYSVQSLGLRPGSADFALSPGQDETGPAGQAATLTEWFDGFPSAPRWIGTGLAACHDEGAQAAALIGFDRLLADQRAWRRSVWSATIPLMIAWVAFAPLWLTVWWPGALGIVALAVLAGGRIARAVGMGPADHAVRAQVLRVVAHAAGLGISPAMAIHAGGLRLHEIRPTWGQPPETREGLARMLDLGAMDTLVLLKGELHSACLRLADLSEARAQAALSRLALAGKIGLSLLVMASVLASLA